jgi:thiol-disulfide isomerase/thioredoxin
MCSGGSAFWATRLALAGMLLVCLVVPELAFAQHSPFDLDGKPVNPLDGASGKIVVLVFLRRDCLISSRYAPVIQQISAEHELDASFFLVFPDKAETPETLNKYLQDYAYRLPALRDPAHVLVRLARVQITPEVAVFNRSHQLIYHGRIDNWYADPGRSRPAPTTHELNDAIQSALAGKMPAMNQVQGVGCYISDLE